MDAAVVNAEKQYATEEHVRSAVEGMTNDDYTRLRHAASALRFGTDYGSVDALIHEAVLRTLRCTMTGVGRRWPLHVPFNTYLYMTMQSIANASLKSPAHTKTDYFDELFAGDAGVDSEAAAFSPGVDDALVSEEQQAAAEAKAKEAIARIEEHFADDDEVLMILFRKREGQTPRQIQQEEGMTKTQYETAMKRFSRGLSKLGFRRGQS
jgi:hypothetical protein